MANLLIACGEPSGDLYAAELLRELRGRYPDLTAYGLGGDRLRAQGADLVAHVADLAVLGLLEVVRHLLPLRRVFRSLLVRVAAQPPDLAVLVDYAGFNLRLARRLRALGVPIVYYVSPQVWAWRRHRVRTIRETVDRMLVLFPFEEEVYARAGVPVTWVGHPLVDLVRGPHDGPAFLRGLGLDPARPVVALLPGSRRREIEAHLPLMAEAVRRLHASRPELQFAVAAAPAFARAGLEEPLRGLPVVVAHGQAHDLLATCAAAVVASGTATVEAALLGAPMVVVYRVSPVTYFLGRRLVRVPHVAMANLIAGRRLVTELIQHDFTPEAVVRELLPLLDDDARRTEVAAGLAEVRRRLGGGGASARAAEEVAQVLDAASRARAGSQASG